ncbi:4-sulfomuconolactone hydrolase [Novosphingobium resinovorum]|uniref:4-sulfomuconolactone hydrolase n=1 Tax=Novosphingobium resinovorum TaxID=158500 RepID=A0A1D8AGT1_9SPHN|nr:4-sulfomuconolactone hydrolase [Novosphingobium resinovorum]AOR81327.1 4-sulfomuconolactone hydrolase [Novosphingobium resinovorum]
MTTLFEATTIPICEGPRDQTAEILFEMPPGAWDTHFHVFGPVSSFPYAEHRLYSPPESPLEDYLVLMEALGIERGVCVHPNVHGADNSVTLDAVARSDGRLLAVIKPHHEMTFVQLRDMKAQGVCGVRFAFNPQHGSGELDTRLFERMLDWCRDLGWCVKLHFAPAALDGLAERLARVDIPIIIDHFGRVDTAQGVDQPHFLRLLDLAKLDHVWIKLTGADRISGSGAPYDDVVPFAHALADVAPDRLLWGSDWPHSGYFDPKHIPNDGDLLNLLARFAPDAELRRKILVDNPQRLFGAA